MAGKSAGVRIFSGMGHLCFRTKTDGQKNIVTTPTEKTHPEAKIVKELLGVTAITDDQLDLMMRKWDLWKAIRVCSWVARFVLNSRPKH